MISSASYFNFGIEDFSGALSGDGTEFLSSSDSVGSTIGGYGVRLIRLWIQIW